MSLSPAAPRVPSAPRARRRLRPRWSLFLSSSWVSAGCLRPVRGHFSGDSQVREAPDGVCLESFSSGRRESGRPPGCPRPRRPRGWGGGGGSTNSPRSPAAEPGGRRLARGGDPRGGEGQVEGKDCGAGSARPAAPAAASHRGPRPPAGGDGWTWGPGSCTPRRDAKALGGWPRRPRGGGPGRLRSAPPPLPAPACVAAAGTPFLHLGGPSPAPQDQTEAPIPPRRPLTGELLPGPGPGPGPR